MERYDEQSTYCRLLGHRLDFKYCRTLTEGLPCRRILDCWHESLPVRDFIEERYSEEEKRKFFSPPPDKLSFILEAVKKARG